MKRLLSSAVLFLCCIITAFAQFSGTVSDSQGVKYTANNDESTCYVSGHEGSYSSDIYISEEYQGRTVTSIGVDAFSYCRGLTSITIGNCVTSIGGSAFEGCSSLTSVTIGNSVTSIGNSAFMSCSGLTSITIPNSVMSIGNVAFNGTAWYNNQPDGLVYAGKVAYKYKGTMPANKTIVLDEGTLGVAGSAFDGCTGLTSITIPESVTSIGNSAFEDCRGLTSVTIPNSVTTIGNRAFYYCSGLTSIVVEDGNSYYDSRENCNALIESASNTLIAGCQNTVIPNSVTSIGGEAFQSCSGLTSITIPNSVTSIGYYAFSNCSGLTSITIPNSVTSIGFGAFYGCSGLTSINIPNSVTSIGACAFERTAWYNNQSDGLVYAGKVAYKYKGTMPANTTIVLEEGTLGIAGGTFLSCSGLTSITIPNSVTSIGGDAFTYCSGLTSIIIPNSVTSIGNYAFYDCSGLTFITIPESVTSIGEMAFNYCSSLTSIVVEDGNSNYDSRDNCNAIIESASNTLIAGCQNTVIPNSVTSIDEWAFRGCTGLTSITIPNSVTNIGGYAFYDCSGLTSITIPNSMTSIGGAAFYGCSGLTSITIPNSVTSIGECAFEGCSGLTSVISEIQEPFGIDGYAFRGAYDTATLMVPVGTKSKYEATDGWKNFANIVEMDLTPVDGGETVDFGDDIDDETNLDGNIVGDILFNISSDDGGYNSAEGCIVVNKPTDDTSIGEGQDIFGEEFRDNFTGIVFKVPAGTGTIKVEAQTTGNMVLKVKIGNNQPVSMELDGRLKATFPYNVTEPTFVYVYGGSKASNAPGMRRVATGANALKLYGITVSRSATSVTNVSCDTTTDNRYYTLDGRTYEGTPTKKGVYIVDGHTVIVK